MVDDSEIEVSRLAVFMCCEGEHTVEVDTQTLDLRGGSDGGVIDQYSLWALSLCL